MNLNQILYQILVIELTDFLKLNAVQRNTLSISVFGEIQQECTKETCINYLSRLLFAKQKLLSEVFIIDITQDLSKKLDPKLVGKKLRYTLEIKTDRININGIVEVGKGFNYLSEPLSLTRTI